MPIKMDAQFLFTVVVLFTTFDAQVLAQNMTTTAAAPSSNVTTLAPIANGTMAPTTAPDSTGAPSSSPTEAQSTSSTPTPSFETRLEVILQVAGKCDDAIIANLSTAVGGVYSSKDYDYKNVTVQIIIRTDEKCTVNITLKFGKKLTIGGIVEKFENAVKNGKIPIGKMEVQSIQVQVEDVTLGEYKASDSDCKAKCCGTGGPIRVNATCEPKYKCVNYKLTKMVADCSKVCKKDDLCHSAGTPLQMSLAILIFGFFVNWLLKE